MSVRSASRMPITIVPGSVRTSSKLVNSAPDALGLGQILLFAQSLMSMTITDVYPSGREAHPPSIPPTKWGGRGGAVG